MSDIYPIAVPKWGIEMVEGTVTTWNKAEGEHIFKGDELFEMESDKIVNVWESPVEGVLRRVLVPAGETHAVGALLGIIASEAVEERDIDAFITGFANHESRECEQTKDSKVIEKPIQTGDAYTRSSPSVRRLADELSIDLGTVSGTGRRGRITEGDVRAAGAANEGVTQAIDIIPLSAIRKTIARRLTEAKQLIPHFYLTQDFELDGLLHHRKKLNAVSSVNVSINDLLVWSVAQALKREPRVNVNLVGEEIHQFHAANISVAIATDSGLYPATVYNADSLSPEEIAIATADLAIKAQNGSLSKEDLSGGSFTVSNLGMFGISQFTAIINPPMGAILALGKATPRTIVKDQQQTIATILTATLSCDHRVIDGAIGAQFLAELREVIAGLKP